MLAIVSYMHWIGDDLPKEKKPKGSGIVELKYLERAADPEKGLVVYQTKCASCHGNDGMGKSNETGGYVYPPLWGPSSYNTGAGLFRLSRFAGYVKANMPYLLATYKTPILTDEESWDVAAFVNSRPRPAKDLSGDWPKISKKPVDHPFGPYADGFTEEQHKFGPFTPIVDHRKKMQKGS
jgi:thiosulfate dehydrogenase